MMTITTAALRELHRIHQQLRDLRERLDRGPRQIQARQNNAESLDEERDAAHENVQKTKVLNDQKQLDLKSGENKIEDLRTKLNACSSNKEYQALLEQIAAAEMANSVLADEILEGFDRIDELEKLAAAAVDRAAQGQRDLEATRDVVREEEQLIRGDLARLQKELEKAEQALPADFQVDYRRVIRGKGADGLAVADDGVCAGCGQQITLNMQNELLLSRAVFCRSCGRLLYLPEDL